MVNVDNGQTVVGREKEQLVEYVHQLKVSVLMNESTKE
jgi:hypothetical protein